MIYKSITLPNHESIPVSNLAGLIADALYPDGEQLVSDRFFNALNEPLISDDSYMMRFLTKKRINARIEDYFKNGKLELICPIEQCAVLNPSETNTSDCLVSFLEVKKFAEYYDVIISLSDAALEETTVFKSNKTTSTISTISTTCTDAGCSDYVLAPEPALTQKSVDKNEQGEPRSERVLIAKERDTSELLCLIYEMLNHYGVGEGDKRGVHTAVKVWGALITGKYKNDLIKSVAGIRNTASIELNGGSIIESDVFSKAYNRRFR